MLMNFNFNGNEDDDNEEINKEMSDIQNEINKEAKEDFYSKDKILQKRLEEYQEAYEYFKKNSMLIRQGNAVKAIEQINLVKESLKKIEENENWKEADISNLPEEITPEFIYGCTYEKRNDEFDKVITYRKKQLKNLENYIKYLEKFPSKREILEKRKKLKEELENKIQIYEQKSKDRWCPPPMYRESIEKNGNIKLENIIFPAPFKEDKIYSNNNNNLNANHEINEIVLNTDISEELLNNEEINEECENLEDKNDNISEDVNNKKNDDSKKSD